jgi:hypothetical protein
MIIEVDTSVLSTDYAESYFTERADRRIMIGLRATLEMLGIPLPDWAERKPTGRKPGQTIAAAHRADHPETLHEATMRKSRDAASRLPTKAQSGGSLSARIAALKAPAASDDPLNSLFS